MKKEKINLAPIGYEKLTILRDVIKYLLMESKITISQTLELYRLPEEELQKALKAYIK